MFFYLQIEADFIITEEQTASQQPSDLNVAEQMTTQQPSDPSGAEQMATQQPSDLGGAEQMATQQPSDPSGAEQMTTQQPSDSSGAEQMTTQQPSDPSGAEQMATQPSDPSGAEQMATQPSDPSGAEQMTTQQPSDPSGAEQMTTQQPSDPNGAEQMATQPSDPSGAEQMTTQQPLDPSGAEQMTTQQPSDPNGAEQMATQPSDPSGAEQMTTQQPSDPSGAEQMTTQQPSDSSGAEQMTTQQPLDPNGAEQMITQQPSDLGGAEQMTTQQPSDPSEAGQTAPQVSEDKAVTREPEMEDEDVKNHWSKQDDTNLFEFEEPAVAASSDKPSAVSKGETQTEEALQQSPKRKRGHHGNTGTAPNGTEENIPIQPVPHFAGKRPRRDYAAAASQAEAQHTEETVSALSGELSSMAIEKSEKATQTETVQKQRSTEEKQFSVSKGKRGKKQQAMKASSTVDFDINSFENLSTSGEWECLFFDELEKGFPKLFSTKNLRGVTKRGRVLIDNPHTLVRDCPEGSSYPDLFGSWTEGDGYKCGPIVKTLDRMVLFSKWENKKAIKNAKECLEGIVKTRRGELRKRSRSYRNHLYMVRVIEGTLAYFTELVEWLSLPNAGPWRSRRQPAPQSQKQKTRSLSA